MGTFFEILCTAVLTFTAGFLTVKYGPKPKRRTKIAKFNKLKNNRFVLFILIFAMLFSSVTYLLGNGYITVQW